MALPAGTALGPYEILALLGAGGMGEVYRAKDTRLDRIVAVKVLPSELSADPALRERLEREAKAISSLTHPHICTLHDVGREAGVDYLVMEHLEGESLADRLRKGALPLEQALRHGIEIAEALDVAHRRGVVHRDLKPGNVMLTKSGAKLLDFGLAKLREGDGTEPGAASALHTELRPLTEIGTILGTYPYMAPEQLEGKQTDGRADIFAFGAMLHEMLTGRRAFDGASRASLIAAILERQPPPVSTLQPLTPSALDHVVTTCLAKDPDERWQSAKDLASALRWIRDAGSQAGTPAPVARRRKTRQLVLQAGAAAAAVAVGVGAGWALRTARVAPPPLLRSSLVLPRDTHLAVNRGTAALSPDGERLAFVASGEDGVRRLFVRSLDDGETRSLAGTVDAQHPFWSPDSRFIAFFSQKKLRRIDAAGGPAQAICDSAGDNGGGGSWGPDGTILFAPTLDGVIYEVPASGGTPRAATALDDERGEKSHRFPQLLPDGRHFIFLVVVGDGISDSEEGGLIVYGATRGSMAKTRIVVSPASARFASGHLLFARGRVLVAQPFAPRTLSLSGEAVPVAPSVKGSFWREGLFRASSTGRLVFESGVASEDSGLVWFDREGRELGTLGGPADYSRPTLSHDQRRLAASIMDPQTGNRQIWVLDLERGTSTRLTFEACQHWMPRWSPDDRTIYFTANRGGNGNVFAKASSGAGAEELVYQGSGWDGLSSISSDGKVAWVFSGGVNSGYDVFRVDLASREAQVAVQTPANELDPDISPDGRWLIYGSNESGRFEVYVQALGKDGGKWQISTEGGNFGKWTRGGKEIVFQAQDGKLMAVEVALEPTFAAASPTVLFDPRAKRRGFGRQYDITADGSRFIVNRPIEPAGAESLSLVENWTSLLER